MQNKADHIELFLFRFFLELRRELHYSLGPPEYLLLFRALEHQQGIGVFKHELLALCEILWLKQVNDRPLFRACFDRAFPGASSGNSTPEAGPELKTREDAGEPSGPSDAAGQGDKTPSPDATKPGERRVMPAPGTANTTAGQETEGVTLALDRGGIGLDQGYGDSPEPAVRRRFWCSQEYLPLNERDLEYFWRFLQVFIPGGPSNEIDLTATVRQIARQGHFVYPSYKPKRLNLYELVLFVDHEGSMASFETLTDRFVHSAQSAGVFHRVRPYYFYNYPKRWLYTDRLHTDAAPVKAVINSLSAHKTIALILSDAGAVRNSANYNRKQDTTALIDDIRRKTRSLVWFNPMPADRWAGNTAAEIALSAPMFELTRSGLNKAVRVLKSGHPFPT